MYFSNCLLRFCDFASFKNDAKIQKYETAKNPQNYVLSNKNDAKTRKHVKCVTGQRVEKTNVQQSKRQK